MGMGTVAALYKQVPKMSTFEKKLVSLGLAVPHWSQYSCVSRLKIEPESGHCYWFGIPNRLELGYSLKDAPAVTGGGNSTQLGSTNAKLVTPNNGDLFNMFVHQVARHVNSSTPYVEGRVGLNMGSQWQHLASMIGLLESDPMSGHGYQTSANMQDLVSQRMLRYIQGMNVRQYVTTKIENVSNLEAFVDTYELSYDHGDRVLGDQLYYTMTDRIGENYFGGGARYGHPNDPFYASDFAAVMLELFALECIKARPAIGGASSAAALQAREHERASEAADIAGVAGPPVTGIGFATAAQTQSQDELKQVLFCHPRNNPLEAWPKGVKNHTGFRLRKVGKRISLAPAQMVMMKNKESFFWSFNESPVGKECLSDPDGEVAWSNATSRRIPNRFRVKFFRYWGDMIQSKGADAVTGAPVSRLGTSVPGTYGDRNNTDFQSGTCSLMVQTERVAHVRLDSRVDSRLVPWPEPFDAPVSYEDQYHIDHDGNFDSVARAPA